MVLNVNLYIYQMFWIIHRPDQIPRSPHFLRALGVLCVKAFAFRCKRRIVKSVRQRQSAGIGRGLRPITTRPITTRPITPIAQTSGSR